MKQAREPQPPRVRKPSVPLKERYARVEAASRAFARRVLPRPADDERTKLFKTFAWSLIGMVFLVVFLSVSVFFLALRGAEETMVPQVVGKDLATAIFELQEKELAPYIQLKFSEDPRDKGNVVTQEPEGGILAKAGRRVTLWVSKGAVVDNVANFVGQNITDVQLRLKTLFANQTTPLLTLTTEPVYVFNSAPEGTVLEQKPVPGTPLSSPTQLVVWVSKGPKGQTVKVGRYEGKSWSEALAQLVAETKPFIVKVRKAEAGEGPGTVVGQAPVAGGDMPKGTPVTLTVAQPAQPTDGRVFQVLETTLPEYPILIDVKIELQKTSGERSTLFLLKHPGGLLTVPFLAAVGDVVAVSVLDKEVFAKKVE